MPMIVHAQFGWSRTLKQGQLIEVYHNAEKLEKNPNTDYLSALANKNKMGWYMNHLDCIHGDVILIESKVGLRGLGPDEYNTFTAIFHVDQSMPESTFERPSVGYYGFPLLKGQIKLFSMLTAKEIREAALKSKISNT